MKYRKAVKIWLLIGLACVIIQVVVGGITRLTESGLSITEWDPLSGAFPPTTSDGWLSEFEKYKATPQYQEINEGMELNDFKFIYFWEFVHREWARIMGFIFLFPFLFFLYKKQIDKSLVKKLSLVILMAIIAATFGWIMVASGLIERPWVNAYKLSFHLCIAFLVYLSLLYAYLYTIRSNIKPKMNFTVQKTFVIFLVIFWIQLFLGGVMSGMRIGVVYPTWPDMNGEFIPQILFNNNLWNVESFNNYDRNELLPALIHFLHRSFAYLVFILGNYIAFRLYKSNDKLLRRSGIFLSIMLIMQVLIGILTVINCIGEIPIFWGVLHQFGALCLLTTVYVAYYITRNLKQQ